MPYRAICPSSYFHQIVSIFWLDLNCNYLFFAAVPFNSCVLSCSRRYHDILKRSCWVLKFLLSPTPNKTCRKCRNNDERHTGMITPIEWDNGEKRQFQFNSNLNLTIGARNMIFKNISFDYFIKSGIKIFYAGSFIKSVSLS